MFIYGNGKGFRKTNTSKVSSLDIKTDAIYLDFDITIIVFLLFYFNSFGYLKLI